MRLSELDPSSAGREVVFSPEELELRRLAAESCRALGGGVEIPEASSTYLSEIMVEVAHRGYIAGRSRGIIESGSDDTIYEAYLSGIAEGRKIERGDIWQ